MDAIQLAFVDEIRKQQQVMKEHLLRMQSHGGDAESIAAIFRAIHDIFCAAHRANGDIGANKYQFIIKFIQVLYDVLDVMRSESMLPDTTLLLVLLACADHLGTLADCMKNNTEPTDAVDKISHSLCEKLHRFTLLPGA